MKDWCIYGFVNNKKGALDSQPQVIKLLAHGRWFSPGTPASSTIKTGRQKHQKSNHLTYLIKIFFAHTVFLLM
jgi:hypothetical protein